MKEKDISIVSVDPQFLDNYDLDFLRRNFGDVEELWHELVSDFLGELPEHFRKIRAAFEKSDIPGLVQTAHSLRGSAANIGLRKLASIAGQLEAAGRTNQSETLPALFALLCEQEPFLRQTLPDLHQWIFRATSGQHRGNIDFLRKIR